MLSLRAEESIAVLDNHLGASIYLHKSIHLIRWRLGTEFAPDLCGSYWQSQGCIAPSRSKSLNLKISPLKEPDLHGVHVRTWGTLIWDPHWTIDPMPESLSDLFTMDETVTTLQSHAIDTDSMSLPSSQQPSWWGTNRLHAFCKDSKSDMRSHFDENVCVTVRYWLARMPRYNQYMTCASLCCASLFDH